MPAAPTLTTSRTFDPLGLLRYLDVALVVLLAPIVLLAGAPALGYAVGAVAWIVQRAASRAIESAASRAADPRRGMTLNMGAAIGRAWAVAGAILAVGLLAEREDGLTAALVVLGAFTVYLAAALIVRPLERRGRP